MTSDKKTKEKRTLRKANNNTFDPGEGKRPVIYQMLPRVFANTNSNLVPNGRIEVNGSGKLNNINDEVLASIADLGITHVWYTGVIEHAHDVDYTRFGIPRHNAHVIKGRAGSPYAIVDYYDIDPDIAEDVPSRMAEFEALIRRTNKAGMGVIIDFVPNHVGRQYHSDAAPRGVRDLGDGDNCEMFFDPSNNFYYITRQQFSPHDVDLGSGEDAYTEFPAKATGNDCFTAFPGRNDWYETVKLNYGYDPGNGSRHFDPIPDTWLKMLHVLRFWAAKGVAGFRCDMAHMVPVEFWHWAITMVKKDYPDIIFIAELYDVGIYRQYIDYGGFDYLYDKVNLYDTLRGIECSHVSAACLTSCWQTVEGVSEKMLNFLENHDEQRFASDFYAGNADVVVPSLVAIATMSKGAVMIYNGQELGERGMDAEGFSGCDGRTTIFDFWSMDTVRRWLGDSFKPGNENLTGDEERLREVYSKILHLVNASEAVREGAFFDLMYVNYHSAGMNPHRHYTYLRSAAGENLLIFLNFGDVEAEAEVVIPDHAFNMLGLPFGEVEAVDLLDDTVHTLMLSPGSPTMVKTPAHGARVLRFGNKPLKKKRGDAKIIPSKDSDTAKK